MPETTWKARHHALANDLMAHLDCRENEIVPRVVELCEEKGRRLVGNQTYVAAMERARDVIKERDRLRKLLRTILKVTDQQTRTTSQGEVRWEMWERLVWIGDQIFNMAVAPAPNASNPNAVSTPSECELSISPSRDGGTEMRGDGIRNHIHGRGTGDGKAGGDPCDGCVYEYEDDDRCGSCTRLDPHREDIHEWECSRCGARQLAKDDQARR